MIQTIEATLSNPLEKLPESALQHREDFQKYVLDHSVGWVRPFLLRFYKLWNIWNEEFFEGAMVPPYIMIAEPHTPRAWGDCSSISGFGGRSQIRIRPSVLLGRNRNILSGQKFESGRLLIGEDILIHEMIHQWQQEIKGANEDSFSGHGPIFRDKCNFIGDFWGLGRVRTCKKRGKDKKLPSCSYWPHCVRPDDYYLGALVKDALPPIDMDKSGSISIPLDPDKQRSLF